MTPDFAIVELQSGEFAQAWPLVRMVAPWLDVERWRQSAEELIERGGCVLAAKAPDGCLYGVATCEQIEKPRAGRVLFVETLVTFELSRRSPVRRFLCDAVECLAPVLGCGAIAIAIPVSGRVPRSWRSSDWRSGAFTNKGQSNSSKTASTRLLFRH